MKTPDQVVNSRRPLGRALAKGAERNAGRDTGWHLDAATYLERVVRLLASPDGGAVERLEIALHVVRKDKEWSKDPEKPAGELARELRQQFTRIVARLDELPCVRRIDSLDDDGVLVLDGMIVVAIGKTGKSGALTAKSLAVKACKRGKAQPVEVIADLLTAPTDDRNPLYWWHLVRPRGLRALARCLWDDVVLPRLKKTPALVMAVAEPIAHLFAPVRREEERNGQRGLRLPGEVLVKIADTAATIGTETLNAIMIDRGVKLFGSLASHRVLRWIIFTAYRQALDYNPDPRVIRVNGGWPVLAHDVIGMKGNKAAYQVRDIIEAMHVTELPLPPRGVYSRLLMREACTPRGRGEQWIRLTIGTGLLPDYVHEMQTMAGHMLEARRWSRLVPVLDIPPVIGRERDHGAQATFSMLLIALFRDHGPELVQHGGIQLDDARITELARNAGLPRDLVRPLLDRWTHDGDDGPAFLRLTDGRYTLGDAHSIARHFIEDGGRRELEGRRAGQIGAAKRRAKLAKSGA